VGESAEREDRIKHGFLGAGTAVRPGGTEERPEREAEQEAVGDEEVSGQGAEDPDRHMAKGFQEPGTPSEKERKQHNLTHLPYRAWCAVCRAARGYTLSHHHHSDEFSDIAIVSGDYFFMGEREEPGCIASLIVKDCRSKRVAHRLFRGAQEGQRCLCCTTCDSGAQLLRASRGHHQDGPRARDLRPHRRGARHMDGQTHD